MSLVLDLDIMTEELIEFTGSKAPQIAQEIEDREQEAIEAWEKEMITKHDAEEFEQILNSLEGSKIILGKLSEE